MGIKSPTNKWLWGETGVGFGSSEVCVPFFGSMGPQRCVLLLPRWARWQCYPRSWGKSPLLPSVLCEACWELRGDKGMIPADPQQNCIHLSLICSGWNLQRLNLSKPPGMANGLRLAVLRSLRPFVCPGLCSRHICMFVFSRRDKSHKQSTSGILWGVSSAPAPPVRHMRYSPGYREHCTRNPCLKSFFWKTHSWRELSLCNSSAF